MLRKMTPLLAFAAIIFSFAIIPGCGHQQSAMSAKDIENFKTPPQPSAEQMRDIQRHIKEQSAEWAKTHPATPTH